MSCPKTEHILQEYFADDLAPLASEEIDRHLAQCAICSEELQALLQTRDTLAGWQESQVPHWDRGVELFRREHQAPRAQTSWFSFWQWVPASASLAMLCILLLNTSVTVNGSSISIDFGGDSGDVSASLVEFQQQQQEELQAIIARFEERQDSNNIQLLQAVMAQTQQTTADNLDRIYAYFEEQRLQDMETMRVSYQQLVDSDYATIQSLQDLAQFVSFQSSVQ